MWSKSESLKDRFEPRLIVNDGCWGWSGRKDNHGYGVMQYANTSYRAHRLSYSLYIGEIPSGMHVLHHCDNPECANPKHLFLGTHADNMRDKTQKKRAHGAHPGEAHYKAKLTAFEVLKILNDLRPHKIIAADFGIARSSVGDIKTGRSWVSVTKGKTAINQVSADERQRYLAKISELEHTIQELQMEKIDKNEVAVA